MPNIRKYKSVAVPIPTWRKLWEMAAKNHRSPAQQIAFLVDASADNPSDVDVLAMHASIQGLQKHD